MNLILIMKVLIEMINHCTYYISGGVIDYTSSRHEEAHHSEECIIGCRCHQEGSDPNDHVGNPVRNLSPKSTVGELIGESELI